MVQGLRLSKPLLKIAGFKPKNTILKLDIYTGRWRLNTKGVG